MPTIASADISVHYDGRGLPEEARVLGEKTGGAMGDAHNAEFEKRLEEGSKSAGARLEKDMKETGTVSGRNFQDAFAGLVKGDMDKLANDVAKVFHDNSGLDSYREKLFGVDREMGQTSVTAGVMRAALKQLLDESQLSEGSFGQFSEEIDKWEVSSSKAEKEAVTFRDSINKLHEEALKANDAFDVRAAQKYADEFINDASGSRAFRDELRNLGIEAGNVSKALDEGDAAFKNYDAEMVRTNGLTLSMREEMDRLHEVALNDDEVWKKMADDFVANADSSSKLRKEMHDLGTEADNIGKSLDAGDAAFRRYDDALVRNNKHSFDGVNSSKDFEKAVRGLGDEVKRTDQAFTNAGSHGRGVSLWTGLIIALVAVIVAVAPDIAALGSALGGLSLEGGLAFGALAVGAIAFKESLNGMFGSLKELPAAAQPAAAALQKVFGSVDSKGKFTPGAMLKEIQDTLTSGVWHDMAAPIEHVTHDSFPVFLAGTKSIATALHNVAAEFTTAFRAPANLAAFKTLLVGLGPTLQALGSALIDLGEGLTQVLATATPFAFQFAKHIHDITEGFADWAASKGGRDAITQWLDHAEAIAPHIGTVFVDLGRALHDLVTAESIANLNQLLDALGQALLSTGQFLSSMNALGPAFNLLFADIFKVLGSLEPALSALFDGLAALVTSTLNIIVPAIIGGIQFLQPLFEAIGLGLKEMAVAFQVVGPVVQGALNGIEAAIKPLVDLIANVLTFAFEHQIEILKIVAPLYKALGDVLFALGQVVGAFIGAWVDAGTSVAGFMDNGKGLEGFLQGPFKSAVVVIAQHLSDFAGTLRNEVIPAMTNEMIPALKNFFATIVDEVIPGIIVAAQNFGSMINIIVDVAKVLGTAATAAGDWAGVFVAAVNNVLTNVTGMAKVIDDVLHGNFVGAFNDAQTAMKNTGKTGDALKLALGKALNDSGNAAKTWNAATKDAAKNVDDIITRTTGYFDKLDKDGKDHLVNLAHNFGLTGKGATAFEGVVASASDGSKGQLARLANDKSLSQVEKDLHLTGSAAKSFESQVKAAMSGSSAATDSTSGKVKGLHTAVIQLPTGKTIKILVPDVPSDIQAVRSLKAEIASIHDRDVTILQHFEQTGQNMATGGHKFGALGGIVGPDGFVAGGQPMHAFAFGGLVNVPTMLNPNSLVGEDGLEAIVPLTKPLSMVDASVRQLSAYARGMGSGFPGTTGETKNVYVTNNVAIPTGDPQAVAGAVVDRLVPQL